MVPVRYSNSSRKGKTQRRTQSRNKGAPIPHHSSVDTEVSSKVVMTVRRCEANPEGAAKEKHAVSIMGKIQRKISGILPDTAAKFIWG